MKQSKAAFTLIELLVVIAIIAILAAILFPVFAQAKVAAKFTATLSNNKEIALAAIMYSNDSDDIAILDGKFRATDAQIYWGGDAYDSWAFLELPYMKSAAIFTDPLASPVAVGAGWTASAWQVNVGNEYGYDYTVFSPSSYGTQDTYGDWVRKPISMTAVARPSDIVLFTEHESYSEFGDWWYGPGTIMTLFADEAPLCIMTAQSYCFANWGTNVWWYSEGFTNPALGANTGLIPFRKQNNTPTTFSDGHAKMMQPGTLAAGTNWTPTLPGTSMLLQNPTIYHWISTQ